ncbi:MAG: RNA methyltransferase [Bacteroidetes bacterium]|nr:RNA methyltransferase [Bacteroidota bacterium]
MLSNKRKKEIISLKQKKFRQRYGQFLVEGEKSVCELFNSNFNITEILLTENYFTKSKIEFDKSKILIISEKDMKSISTVDTPPGIIAVSNFKDLSLNLKNLENKITLVVDDISAPGNLGTIIRIADWYGIENLICSLNTVDMYNPKTINATMGSFARVNVFYRDLSEFLNKTKIKKYACVMNGNSIETINKQSEAIILIGNESKGISSKLIKSTDLKITIPRKGGAESLNAAIAAAIICHKFVFG